MLGDGALVRRSGISCKVARARLYHDDARFQVDHILTETDQHLRRGLVTDAAVQKRFSRKELRPALAPHLGDVVAEEDDAVHARTRCAELGGLTAVAREAAPVGEE